MDRAHSAVLRGRLSWPLLYLLAPVSGALVATGSLAYDPLGRINVLPLLVLWGVLPALGSLAAVFWAVRGGQVPWPVRRDQRLALSPGAVWSTGARLQWVWAGFAGGLMLSFLAHLAFTDLAFGWSSTLVAGNRTLASAVQAVSLPWAAFWPEAVPDVNLIAASRYERIAPTGTDGSGAGWWPFLAAVVLTYSLLPRVLLGLLFAALARRASAYATKGLHLRVEAAGQSAVAPASAPLNADPLSREPVEQWSGATRLCWQHASPGHPEGDTRTFGLGEWATDARHLQALLDTLPAGQSLLWTVPLVQTPVAELADLIQMAREAGHGQGLSVDGVPSAATDRFILSWQAFARQHQLVWVESAGEVVL